MDYFARRRATRASTPSTQSTPTQAQQTPGRNRHSVAASTLAVPRPTGGRRSIFGNAQPNRPSTHQELPPRSISASYVPSVRSAGTNRGIPRSRTTYGRGRSLAQIAASPEKPKPRNRMERLKTGICERLSPVWEWIPDKWMEFMERIDMIEFGEMGYSFGIGLIGFHLIIRVIIALEKARRNLVGPKRSPFSSGVSGAGERLSEARALAKSRYSLDFLDVLWLFSILMCLFSCYNTYKLFTARRPYRMQIREDPINSPNATLVQSPIAPQMEPKTWGQICWKMARRMSSLLIGWPRAGADDVAQASQIYQLDVWDPSELRLKIYVLYNPGSAFLLHSGNLSENAMTWTLAILAIAFSLVKDKIVVQAEVMHEYNAQFVYPRVFPPTRDWGTMTSSAEFIRREDWLEY